MKQIIRVVDLETTGFKREEGHEVIEIGWCDVVSSNLDLIGRPTMWRVTEPAWLLCDPGRDIPPESSAVHHIINADVEGGPPFAERAQEVLGPDFLEVDETIIAYAGHSAEMERQWCEEHTGTTPWICTYKSALWLWPDAPTHSNQGLRYWRMPPHLDRRLSMPSHRAGPDSYVTAHLLAEMLNHEEKATVEQLVEWADKPALEPRCRIGKYRGSKWSEVDFGFLQWVYDRDFGENVHFTVEHEMQRRQDEQRRQQEEQDDAE